MHVECRRRDLVVPEAENAHHTRRAEPQFAFRTQLHVRGFAREQIGQAPSLSRRDTFLISSPVVKEALGRRTLVRCCKSTRCAALRQPVERLVNVVRQYRRDASLRSVARRMRTPASKFSVGIWSETPRSVVFIRCVAKFLRVRAQKKQTARRSTARRARRKQFAEKAARNFAAAAEQLMTSGVSVGRHFANIGYVASKCAGDDLLRLRPKGRHGISPHVTHAHVVRFMSGEQAAPHRKKL